jgi:hypothetical protein
MDEKIGAGSWAIMVDKMRSTDIHVQILDHHDTPIMHTHTALNWSDPAVYDSDVHLSLATVTDFFGLVEWDATVTCEFAEGMYAVRLADHALAGDELIRVIADGSFAKTEHTMYVQPCSASSP